MQAIYQIRNKINNKIYIGSTNNINKRWNNHKSKLNNKIHENSYLQAAWDKYGEENFEFSIIEQVNDQNRIEKEIFYLQETKSYERHIGYNFDKNPTDKSGKNNPFYGKQHSKETKDKIKLIANNRSDELKNKMGEKNRGENHGQALLNWDIVREIRRLYELGGETHRSLALKYNVSYGTISAILYKRSWKDT
jgi:group I intron endonuclease